MQAPTQPHSWGYHREETENLSSPCGIGERGHRMGKWSPPCAWSPPSYPCWSLEGSRRGCLPPSRPPCKHLDSSRIHCTQSWGSEEGNRVPPCLTDPAQLPLLGSSSGTGSSLQSRWGSITPHPSSGHCNFCCCQDTCMRGGGREPPCPVCPP